MTPNQWKAKQLCDACIEISKCPLIADETLALCLAYHTADNGITNNDYWKLAIKEKTFARYLSSLTSAGYLEVTSMIKIANTRRNLYSLTTKGRQLLETTIFR